MNIPKEIEFKEHTLHDLEHKLTNVDKAIELLMIEKAELKTDINLTIDQIREYKKCLK